MDIPLGGVSAKRQIGMADLLFWAQKLLEADDSFSVEDCRDGTLFARILAKIVDSRSGRALEGAINKDARTRDDRLENLALVCTVMREGGGEGWDGDVQEVEDANEEAIIDLLMAMYRLYFKNCTTQVKRVRVRAQTAHARGSSSAGRGGTSHARPATMVDGVGGAAKGGHEYDAYSAKLSAHARWLLRLIVDVAGIGSFSGDGAWDAVAEEVLSILDALNRSGQLRPGRSRDRFEKLCGDGIMYKLSIDAMLGSGDDDEGRGRGVVERLVERAPELRGLDEGRLYVDVFDREAHLAILDTLAHIRISSLASIADLHESSTRACISCSAQTPPYPSDLEDALASWLSSRCLAAIMDMDGSDMGPHAALASRLGFASGSPTFDDLQFDISDGRGLLLLLSHHSPRAIASGSTASGVCKTLGDKMSNCRAVIAACDALGLSLLLSPDDLVQVDPGMRVLVNLFLSSIFMRVERPAAYSRLTNTAKYAESVQALPGMAPSDSQGEGTVLGQTAGGSKVMLEILNVDRHAKQHQQQQQQQKPVGAASRRRKPSEHGPEVLIIEHSPATSPTDARDDGTGNRNDNSNYLHSSPSGRSVAPLGKNKSSADGIGFLSSTPARVLNKSSLEGIGYLGSPHTPHANLLGKSSLVARSPTPRIAPSPAEGSPKPKLSPAAVAATGLGGGKYFDGRLSDGEGDWGVVPAVTSSQGWMGGSGGWVGERGSLVKVDANGAEGQSLLSSGVIKEELMDLARAAASEEEELEEESEEEEMKRMEEELNAYRTAKTGSGALGGHMMREQFEGMPTSGSLGYGSRASREAWDGEEDDGEGTVGADSCASFLRAEGMARMGEPEEQMRVQSVSPNGRSESDRGSVDRESEGGFEIEPGRRGVKWSPEEDGEEEQGMIGVAGQALKARQGTPGGAYAGGLIGIGRRESREGEEGPKQSPASQDAYEEAEGESMLGCWDGGNVKSVGGGGSKEGGHDILVCSSGGSEDEDDEYYPMSRGHPESPPRQLPQTSVRDWVASVEGNESVSSSIPSSRYMGGDTSTVRSSQYSIASSPGRAAFGVASPSRRPGTQAGVASPSRRPGTQAGVASPSRRPGTQAGVSDSPSRLETRASGSPTIRPATRSGSSTNQTETESAGEWGPDPVIVTRSEDWGGAAGWAVAASNTPGRAMAVSSLDTVHPPHVLASPSPKFTAEYAASPLRSKMVHTSAESLSRSNPGFVPGSPGQLSRAGAASMSSPGKHGKPPPSPARQTASVSSPTVVRGAASGSVSNSIIYRSLDGAVSPTVRASKDQTTASHSPSRHSDALASPSARRSLNMAASPSAGDAVALNEAQSPARVSHGSSVAVAAIKSPTNMRGQEQALSSASSPLRRSLDITASLPLRQSASSSLGARFQETLSPGIPFASHDVKGSESIEGDSLDDSLHKSAASPSRRLASLQAPEVLATVVASPSRRSAASPSRVSAASPSRVSAASPSRVSAASPSRVSAASPSRVSAASPSRVSAASPSRRSAASPSRVSAASPSRVSAASPSRVSAASSSRRSAASPSRRSAASPSRVSAASPSRGLVAVEEAEIVATVVASPSKRLASSSSSSSSRASATAHIATTPTRRSMMTFEVGSPAKNEQGVLRGSVPSLRATPGPLVLDPASAKRTKMSRSLEGEVMHGEAKDQLKDMIARGIQDGDDDGEPGRMSNGRGVAGRSLAESLMGEAGEELSAAGGASAWLRLGDERWEGTTEERGIGGDDEDEDLYAEGEEEENAWENRETRPSTAPAHVALQGWAQRGASDDAREGKSNFLRMKLMEAARDIGRARDQGAKRAAEEREKVMRAALMQVLKGQDYSHEPNGTDMSNNTMRHKASAVTSPSLSRVMAPAAIAHHFESAGRGGGDASDDVDDEEMYAKGIEEGLEGGGGVYADQVTSPQRAKNSRDMGEAELGAYGRMGGGGNYGGEVDEMAETIVAREVEEADWTDNLGAIWVGGGVHESAGAGDEEWDDSRDDDFEGQYEEDVEGGSLDRENGHVDGSYGQHDYGHGRTGMTSVHDGNVGQSGNSTLLPSPLHRHSPSPPHAGRASAVPLVSSMSGSEEAGEASRESWGLSNTPSRCTTAGGDAERARLSIGKAPRDIYATSHGSPVSRTKATSDAGRRSDHANIGLVGAEETKSHTQGMGARAWKAEADSIMASAERRIQGDADLRTLVSRGGRRGEVDTDSTPVSRGERRSPASAKRRVGGDAKHGLSPTGVLAVGATENGSFSIEVGGDGVVEGRGVSSGASKTSVKFEAFKQRREEEARQRQEAKGRKDKGATPASGKKLAPTGASARNSNRKLIRNAITHVLLVSEADRKRREAAVAALDQSPSIRFIVMLSRDPNLKFRGVYESVGNDDVVSLVHGTGPSEVDSDMVREFLRYDSGSKTFKELSTSKLGFTTDAFVLHPHAAKRH